MRKLDTYVVTKEEKKDYYNNSHEIFSYQIYYPQFYRGVCQRYLNRVNYFYQKQAENRKGYCEEELYASSLSQYQYSQRFVPNQYQQTYKMSLNKEGLISLYQDVYTFMGGAHGSTKRESQTWDTEAKRKLTLRDVTSYSDEEIIAEIIDQIEGDLEDKPGIYFDDYEELVRSTFNNKQFYLIDQGVIIYFQQYDIAPYAGGIKEFLIVPKELTIFNDSVILR